MSRPKKYNEPTTTVQTRVPNSKVTDFKKKVGDILVSYQTNTTPGEGSTPGPAEPQQQGPDDHGPGRTRTVPAPDAIIILKKKNAKVPGREAKTFICGCSHDADGLFRRAKGCKHSIKNHI